MFIGLTAHNYRAFPKVTFEPKHLTFLLGPNNSGKSSLIQLLKILAQTAAASSRGDKTQSALALGGPFATVLDASDLFRSDSEEVMRLQIRSTVRQPRDDETRYYTLLEILDFAARIGITSDKRNVQQHSRSIRRHLQSGGGRISERSLIKLIRDTFSDISPEEGKRLLEVVQDFYFRHLRPRRNPHQMKDEDVARELNVVREHLIQEVRVEEYFRRQLNLNAVCTLDVALSLQGKNIKLDSASLYIASEEVFRAERTGSGVEVSEIGVSDEGEASLSRIGSEGRVNLDGSIFTFLIEEARRPPSTRVGTIVGEIRSSISALNPVYVGPYRSKPSSVYVIPEHGGALDYVFDVVRRISEDEDRTQRLNEIARQFGFHLNLPKLVESVYALSIGKTAELRHFPASSVGFGLVHLLPILDALAFASDGRLIVVEQPEAHLHPELHAKIADMFISVAKTFPKSIFVIETHSDHLLSRIGRRMRDAKFVVPEEVAILYVDQSEAGLSKLSQLRIDERGDFQWPLGFISSKLMDQVGQLPPPPGL